LASITLSTDGQGNKLIQPANLLVAGLWDTDFPLPAAATVAVRDDATNKWITTDLINFPEGNYQAMLRAITTHKDRVTGIDYVFAAFVGVIYHGVYDATVPGQIRWESNPELMNFDSRLMSFGECNGELYASIKLAIYKRIDGAAPTWEKVYEYPIPTGENASTGMRGLTAVPNPEGDGEVLLMALEGYSADAKIVYLDPSDNSVTTDLDAGAFLKEQLKDTIGTDWDHVVVAYNDMVRITDPKANEDLILMGLGVNDFNSDSGWYLVRHADATYTVHEIPFIFDFHGMPRALYGTRTIRVSPFAQDNGQVIYFGGFDCSFKTSHNTAWIYSADIATVLGE
jgi:poly(A) polymerase